MTLHRRLLPKQPQSCCTAILNFGYFAFLRHHRCILNRTLNNSIKFGRDWSISEGLATVYQNPRWRLPPSWDVVQVQIFDITVTLSIEFTTFPPNLVSTDQISNKRQQFFKIRDGGSRHLELKSMCVFRHDRCISHRSHTNPTKFGEDWSIGNDSTTLVWNPKWC